MLHYLKESTFKGNVFSVLAEQYIPKLGTKHAGCLDIQARLLDYHKPYEESYYPILDARNPMVVDCYTSDNELIGVSCTGSLILNPYCTYKIPTGIFVSMATPREKAYIYSRSGNSLKKGIIVLNAPGVIDVDYRNEVCVILCNTRATKMVIEDGDSIAQLEFKYTDTDAYSFIIGTNDPIKPIVAPLSTRTGGFGTTGVIGKEVYVDESVQVEEAQALVNDAVRSN